MNKHIIPKSRIAEILTTSTVPYIAVRARSGFGKTSVFAETAEKLRGAVGWYTTSFSDNNICYFSTGMEELWEKLDQKAERSYIILDGLQVITSEEVLQYIFFMHRYVGDKITFILLTNGDIPKGFMSFLLQGEGLLLTEDDLRLTPEEVCQHMAGDRDLSWKILRQVTWDMYGWPLGIRCALDFLCDRKWDIESEKLPWKRILQETMLSQYLDEILWNTCSGEIQIFLKNTSILNEFSWEACQSVLPGQLSRKTFEAVVAEKGFVRCISAEQDIFQYSRMFQAYLSRMLSDRERRENCRKAALWYYRRKDFQKMTEYAVQGGQDDLLVMATEQFGAVLLCQEGQIVLGEMVTHLEGNMALLPPGAAGIVAQYFYSQGNFAKMEEYLNAADSSFGKENQYGCYRSLYRALTRLEEDSVKYRKQIHNALFFLKESGLQLPFLRKKDRSKLDQIMAEERAGQGNKKLHVYTFGPFRVIPEGEDRGLTWRTRKGRELFAYLLDQEGSAVERDNLMGVLWPEEIPVNAVAMLHNMVYNMRKELSAYCLEKIIFYEKKQYRLIMDNVVCDLYPIRRIAGLVEKKKMEELRSEYRYFLTYWGAYLEDIDNFWVERNRRYYDDIYIKGCLLLADQFTREKEYETAVIFCKNILSLDPYSEKTIEKLLFLYGERKEWERMRQCFRAFKELLWRDLGIMPGEEILTVYHRYIK